MTEPRAIKAAKGWRIETDVAALDGFATEAEALAGAKWLQLAARGIKTVSVPEIGAPGGYRERVYTLTRKAPDGT